MGTLKATIFGWNLASADALRIIALITSILFVSVVAHGGLFIWTVIFGVVLALFFDARLRSILEKCVVLEGKLNKAFFVASRYVLLLLDITCVATIGAFILIVLNIKIGHLFTLDQAILSYSPFVFLKSGHELDYNFTLFVASLNPLCLAVFISIFLSFSKLLKTSETILYPEVFTKKNGREIYHPERSYIYFQMPGMGIAVILIIFEILFFNFVISNFTNSFYLIFHFSFLPILYLAAICIASAVVSIAK